MAMLNIPSTKTDDPQYRYKMPPLVTKMEGSGNGIKTCVVNMTDVARALKCPPTYPMKLFAYELGATSTFTTKEGEGDRAIAKGEHGTSTFQILLDKFIDMYILCPNCRYPEIDLYVKKNGMIHGTCKACAWCGDLDNDHKLANFIQKNPPPPPSFSNKNPPDGGVGIEGEKVKMDKKERQRLKAEKQRKEAVGSKKAAKDDDDNISEAEQKKTQKKEKNVRPSKKETRGKKEVNPKKTDEDDQDGFVDLNGKAADSDAEVDDELRYDSEETQNVITILSEFVVSKDGDPPVADFFEELRLQQLAKIFDNKVRFYVAIQALFGKIIVGKEIPGKAKYLTKVIQNASMSPQDILWGFEVYLVNNPAAKKTYPMTLQGLYNADMVTEEQLLKHYTKDLSTPGFATAKKAAKPFLDWLEEASEDLDSDEN